MQNNNKPYGFSVLCLCDKQNVDGNKYKTV